MVTSGLRWANGFTMPVLETGYVTSTGGAAVLDGGRHVLELSMPNKGSPDYRADLANENAPGPGVKRWSNLYVKSTAKRNNINVFLQFSNIHSGQQYALAWDNATTSLLFGYYNWATGSWTTVTPAVIADNTAWTWYSIGFVPNTRVFEIWANGTQKITGTGNIAIGSFSDTWMQPDCRYIGGGAGGNTALYKDFLGTIETGSILNGRVTKDDYVFGDHQSPNSDDLDDNWIGNPDNVDLFENWNAIPFNNADYNSLVGGNQTLLSGFPASAAPAGKQVRALVAYCTRNAISQISYFRARISGGTQWAGDIFKSLAVATPAQWTAYDANGAGWDDSKYDGLGLGVRTSQYYEHYGLAIEPIYGPEAVVTRRREPYSQVF